MFLRKINISSCGASSQSRTFDRMLFLHTFSKEDDIMAKAKKLKSGSLRCLVYDYTNEKGKRHYKSFTSTDPSARGKHEAERMAADYAAEKESVGNVQDITFGEALDRYIESRESVLSPRTVMDYKRIRRNELQSIMDVKVSLITQEDIQRAINIEAQTHSPKTVRNSHGVVSAVMRVYRPNFALNTSLPKKYAQISISHPMMRYNIFSRPYQIQAWNFQCFLLHLGRCVAAKYAH